MDNLRTSIAKAIVMVALGSTSGFAAADVQDLVVQAQVSGVCKFGNIPALDFGTIDPSTVAANVTGSSIVEYRCTKNTAPASLSAAAGPYVMLDGAKSLAFTLTVPAVGTLTTGGGFGGAAFSTFTIGGTILLADAQAAAAGTGYTKTVALTITP